jgi:hypothetical protein
MRINFRALGITVDGWPDRAVPLRDADAARLLSDRDSIVALTTLQRAPAQR